MTMGIIKEDSDIFLFDQSFSLSCPKADDVRPILLDTPDEVPGTTDPKKVNSCTFSTFLLSIWMPLSSGVLVPRPRFFLQFCFPFYLVILLGKPFLE